MNQRLQSYSTYRVRFVHDIDATFEESNGEARPLTRAEYAESPYRGCPQHPRAGTIVISKGGHGRPQVQGCAICRNTKYQDLPYEEYRAYYGDPTQHVYLGCIVEGQCDCCASWVQLASLWSIDMMIDDPALERIRLGSDEEYLSPDQALALPGYLAEVAREELEEAGWKPAKRSR